MNKGKHGVIISNLDKETNPKDNFYQYCAGGWRKSNPIPKEFSSYGVFGKLSENTRDQVKELITSLSTHPDAKTKGSIAQKVSDLYEMGMDMERRNNEGNSPLKPILERIETYHPGNFPEIVAWLSLGLDNTFFGFGIGPDMGDSSHNMLHVGEAGLGLGDRDYYLEKNDTNERILDAYRKYVRDLMNLAGFDNEASLRISDTVLWVETEMAKHKKTREESRNPLLYYNIMTMDEAEQKYPNLHLKRIFELVGLPELKTINIMSPKFMEFINSFIPKLTDRQVKDMMAYGSVSSSAGALSESFYDVMFEMFDRVLSGTEEKKPLWKRAQGMVSSLFGEAIGQLYVEKYFPEENKRYMLGLVENLREALGDHIRVLSWMTEDTKSFALDKLKKMNVKVGYPNKWKDYSGIEIDPDKTYMENLLIASEWFKRDNFSKLAKPVDREEWFMYPQTVNAYYSPQMNEICFPAGILQPPFFDITADDAMNYGGIGVVIGHEMTHGFDDSGRNYDADGNLKNWWSKEDEEKFKKLTERLVEQFNNVEVAPGVKANGQYTLGENIADQGGLRIALSALRKAMPEIDSITADSDGFTPVQRFYISYGGIWASNIRPEEILVRTKTDPHSLAENRVNETLKNIGPFMDAFQITQSDRMYKEPEERTVIW